jgi:cephalosporin-C deacetylase
MTSLEDHRTFAYLSVPTGDGPFPAVMRTPYYGSINPLPPYADRCRRVAMQVIHRGQRLANRPFVASYPGLITDGIESPRTYVYRGIVADCLRAAEILRAHPKVNEAKIAISGDDLAVITSARRQYFAGLYVVGLQLHRLLEATSCTTAYPTEELSDYLRAFPGSRQAIALTLSYYEPIHHVANLRASALVNVGDPEELGGPQWLEAFLTACGSQVRAYRLTHADAADARVADAWLTRILGGAE